MGSLAVRWGARLLVVVGLGLAAMWMADDAGADTLPTAPPPPTPVIDLGPLVAGAVEPLEPVLAPVTSTVAAVPAPLAPVVQQVVAPIQPVLAPVLAPIAPVVQPVLQPVLAPVLAPVAPAAPSPTATPSPAPAAEGELIPAVLVDRPADGRRAQLVDPATGRTATPSSLVVVAPSAPPLPTAPVPSPVHDPGAIAAPASVPLPPASLPATSAATLAGWLPIRVLQQRMRSGTRRRPPVTPD